MMTVWLLGGLAINHCGSVAIWQAGRGREVDMWLGG
jgi:hypothetical protein